MKKTHVEVKIGGRVGLVGELKIKLDSSKAKIRVRKSRGSWWVFVPGPIPEFAKFQFFTDALAMVHYALRSAYK